MSFSGDFKRAQKVSLAGRSRPVESREQVLERTHQERERRKQQKLESRSAGVIQTAWRAYFSLQQARAEVHARWVHLYGPFGQNAAASDLAPTSPFLRELLFFAEPSSTDGATLIAAVCRLALPFDGANGQPLLCAAAAGAAGGAAVTVLRAQRLVALALASLSLHASELQPSLSVPRQVRADASPAAALVDAAVVLTSSDAWKAALGPTAATGASAQILAHAAGHGLFSNLAKVVMAGCAEDGGSWARTSVPLAETLCTAVVVRYSTVQGAIEQRMQRERAARSPPSSQPATLLCVPALLQRCPSLKPLAGRIWRAAVADLHRLTAPQLATWLPADLLPQGKAGAAAALLGNLLEGVAGALHVDSSKQAGAARLQALQYCQLAGTLLSLLPLQLFARAPSMYAKIEEDEEEESNGNAAAVGAAMQPLPWPAGELPAAVVLNQLQLASDTAVLAACVRAALPAATAAEALPVDEPVGVAAAAVRQLCNYVSRVTSLPGHRRRALLGLALSAGGLVQRLWFSYLRAAHAAGSSAAWAPAADDPSCDPGWMRPLTLLSEAFSICIVVAGDEGLYERQQPLPLGELYAPEQPRGLLSLLKAALWHVLWAEAQQLPSPATAAAAATALRTRHSRSVGRLMGQLHDRNGRRPFAPAEAFYAEGLPPERFHAEVAAGAAAGRDAEDPGASRAWALLSHAPFLVPFVERARVFSEMVATQRAQYRERDDMSAVFGAAPSRFISVRRGQVLPDAFAAIGAAPPEALRGRLRISFVSEWGWEEAGVDGGGLFKEFLEAVVKEGFDPGAGLFRATSDNRLYPAPLAAAAAPGAPRLLEFLGRMVGKALWEGILLELPLAPFFLRKLRGGVCDIDDLPTLDPQLARNLASLKAYPGGDVSELGLTFSISDDVAGRPVEVELVPGGQEVAVTASNAAAYVQLVADHRLNVQLREPAAAFLRGLHALIPRDWVAMFNDSELQELIGGAEGGALDLDDMRRHVQYGGGYSDDHPVIQAFWGAMHSLTPAQQADFLRFVTSCPRPPLLGFAYLQPPLSIQAAGGEGAAEGREVERLPTAATCMNLLKLPPYRGGAEAVRRKLVYAIEAKAGFDLS